MVLVEASGEVRINEQARDRLKEIWPLAYESNLQQFIPEFAEELSEGQIPITGVKTLQ
jgi:hypothetical protein